jgi:hypothetical protein
VIVGDTGHSSGEDADEGKESREKRMMSRTTVEKDAGIALFGITTPDIRNLPNGTMEDREEVMVYQVHIFLLV